MNLINNGSKQNVDQLVQSIIWKKNLARRFVDVGKYALDHMNKKNKMLRYVKQVQPLTHIVYYILTKK
jgi:hypothetical protein